MSGYLDLLYLEVPETVLKVVEMSRKKLKTRPLTRTEYVAVLVKNGCVGLAAALARLWQVPCPVLTAQGTLTYEDSKAKKKGTKPAK